MFGVNNWVTLMDSGQLSRSFGIPSPSWREGMFLLPQTFQQLEAYLHSQVGLATRIGRSNYYGFLEWDLDEEALRNWRLQIRSLVGQTKTGILFSLSAGEIPSCDLNLPEFNKIKESLRANRPVDVMLAFPAIRPNDKNISTDNESGGGTGRYRELPLECPDMSTGSQSREIRVKTLRPQIHFSAENQRDFDYLRICRVKLMGASPSVDETAWVPMLHTEVLAATRRWLENVDNRLEAYLREMNEYFRSNNKRLRNLNEAVETEFLICFQALSEFRGWLLARKGLGGIDPRDVHLMLCQTLGRLTWILGRETNELLPTIPSYDHDNCWEGWQNAWSRIESCFIRPRDKNEREIPLLETQWQVGERRETVHIAEIDSSLISEGWRFYLGIFCGDEHVQLLLKEQVHYLFLPNSAAPSNAVGAGQHPAFFDANFFRWKIGAAAEIESIFSQVKSGVTIEYPAPSKAGLPKRTGWIFYDIKQSVARGAEDYWRQVLDTRKLCLRIAPEDQWKDAVKSDPRDIRLRDGRGGGEKRYRFRMSLWAVRPTS